MSEQKINASDYSPPNVNYWGDRCCRAEAELTRLQQANAALVEERDDARSSLEAWFDLATKTEDKAAPVVMDGLRQYLRTSQSGGMPSELANAVETVLEDYCRLYLGKHLVPVLRGIALASQ